MKKGPESELLERYGKRSNASGRQIGISGPHVSEWPESKLANSIQRKEEESRKLLSGANRGAMLICLDETGSDLTSPGFADLLRSNLDSGVTETAFVIGGPDGLGELALQASSMKLCLGRMTWPHQLARVMLAEQLYRAITILTGHPYHRI